MTQDKFKQRYEEACDIIMGKIERETGVSFREYSHVIYFAYLSGAQGALESLGTAKERKILEKELEMLEAFKVTAADTSNKKSTQ